MFRLGLLGAMLVLASMACAAPPPTPPREISLGNADANLVLVEWGDFQ